MISVELAVCIITALGALLVALIEAQKAKHDVILENRLTQIENRLDTVESTKS